VKTRVNALMALQCIREKKVTMDVLMPQLGETVAEGKIVKWFKAAGDAVKPGDNLFEIETDKTSMEVPSTVAGTLAAIHFQVGDVARVGAVVAEIAGAGEAAASSPKPAPDQSAPAPRPQPPLIPAQAGIQTGIQTGIQDTEKRSSRTSGDERAKDFAYPDMTPFREVRTPEKNYGPARLAGGAQVTPLARRLAGERGIDLSAIKGSGPHGRIVARDVETVPPMSAPANAAQVGEQVRALYAGVDYDEVPLDGMRATVARRLAEAKRDVPHFYLTADIDIGRLIALREEANAAAPRDKNGEPAFKLSLNDFIIKMWAAALQRVPAANAVWAGDRILRFKSSDIGVAVALDDGVITPILRGAERQSVSAIAAGMRDLAARARDKKLRPDEVRGGASAISNLGMYGVREFAAIVNPPHATILAVGSARRAPVEAEDGGVRFISQIAVTLSCDRRVVDGALGAQLLAAFKGFVEHPVTALV
jgi:pyruvate dehydrogenase E2 component (dihydrolipoamide acetyltransferase)